MFIKNIQAMLLLSEKVPEIIFQRSGELNFKNFPTCVHYGGASRRCTKHTVKKLNLWGKMAVDKSAWMKAWVAVENTYFLKKIVRDRS